ncbi:hypothetical protein C1645_750907 [Glomus cerebriforme]|uniref:Uncharacterized protein n=1 Tax=Glomus cerebriforme TaxID=658196 RepID=A0A397TIL3_9GLOM|nr:hypothetical protein C1645_750907 [Glomus cerebriforme]
MTRKKDCLVTIINETNNIYGHRNNHIVFYHIKITMITCPPIYYVTLVFFIVKTFNTDITFL